MIPPKVVLFWLIFLNLVALGLYVCSKKRLPASTAKDSFLFFLIGYLSWLNPLLLIQILGTSSVGRLLSQCILAGGVVFVSSLGRFIITFAAPSELRTIRYWTFQANFAVLFVLAFSGLFEQGIQISNQGLAPIKGPLQPYFDLSMVAFGAYFLTVCGKAYIHSKDELLRCQLRTIFWTCLPAFTIGLITNAVIPGLTGNFQLTPTGGLWLLYFFAGVTYIMLSGKAILARDALRELLDEPAMTSEKNVTSLRFLFETIRFIVAEKPDRFLRRLCFRTSTGENVDLVLSRTPQLSKARSNSTPPGDLPEQDWQMTMNRLSALQSENKYLSLSLSKAQSIVESIKQDKSQTSLSRNTLPSSDYITLADYESTLLTNIEENQKLYGVRLLSFSSSLIKTLKNLDSLSTATGALMIEGETGTGKRVLANALHNLRGGSELVQIFCDSIDSEELCRIVKCFVSETHTGQKNGLLVRHLDRLPGEQYSTLLELYKHTFSGNRSVYFTFSPGFLEEAKGLPYGIVSLFEKNLIRIPPLRMREDDIFHQLLWFVLHYSTKQGQAVEKIHPSVTETAAAYPWHGNTRELEHTVQKALAERKDKQLDHLHPAPIPELSATENKLMSVL